MKTTYIDSAKAPSTRRRTEIASLFGAGYVPWCGKWRNWNAGQTTPILKEKKFDNVNKSGKKRGKKLTWRHSEQTFFRVGRTVCEHRNLRCKVEQFPASWADKFRERKDTSKLILCKDELAECWMMKEWKKFSNAVGFIWSQVKRRISFVSFGKNIPLQTNGRRRFYAENEFRRGVEHEYPSGLKKGKNVKLYLLRGMIVN